jgi:outer membrane protein
MPRSRRLAAIAASALSLTVASGVARGADLLEIYKQARDGEVVYRAANASWIAAQEKLPQGRAGLLPTISAAGTTQFNDRTVTFRDPSIVGGKVQFNSNTLSLSLNQPLYRRQNIVVYQQGRTQIEQASHVLAQAEQDLVTRVAQAYLDVLLARDNVAFTGAQKAAIAEQLAQAKISFQVGTATITDTHDAQARYDLANAQEITAKSDLEVKQRTLELIIGKQTPALAPLGAGLQLLAPEPAVQDKWVEESRSANPLVRSAESNLTLAQQEIDRNRGGHFPTLDAFAAYNRNAQGAGTLTATPGFDTRVSSIGLQLAVPIYQGGVVNSRVREAAANAEKARQELENARRTAELGARQNYVGVTSGVAQVKALESAVVSSQSSLDSTLLGREVGVRTQVDVLNAQQQLFSARRDLAQAKYAYIMSTLKLKAAVGRLSEQDVVAVNAWLDHGK